MVLASHTNDRWPADPDGCEETEPELLRVALERTKEISMMRSILNCAAAIGRMARDSRTRQSTGRRLPAAVEGLETRSLMTAGSVVLSPGQVVITPASTGPNTTIVSYQNVNGALMLDVQLNGANNYFRLTQVGIVYYKGSGASAHKLSTTQRASSPRTGAALEPTSSRAGPAKTSSSAARAPTRSTLAAASMS